MFDDQNLNKIFRFGMIQRVRAYHLNTKQFVGHSGIQMFDIQTPNVNVFLALLQEHF